MLPWCDRVLDARQCGFSSATSLKTLRVVKARDEWRCHNDSLGPFHNNKYSGHGVPYRYVIHMSARGGPLTSSYVCSSHAALLDLKLKIGSGLLTDVRFLDRSVRRRLLVAE